MTDILNARTPAPAPTPDILSTLCHHLATGERVMRPETIAAAVAEVERLRAEVADLRCSVIAFGAPWAADYARQFGLPRGHLHPTHYDILARAGARMNDFTRASDPESGGRP